MIQTSQEYETKGNDDAMNTEENTRLQQIQEQLEFLNNHMEKQAMMKEDLISRLHNELDYYKKDSASRFEDQLLKAVIKVYCSMKKNLSSEKFQNKSAEELLEEYRYVFEDLMDLLSLQNCDEIESNPGDAFNPSIHQAKIEPTDQPELHRIVKCSLAPGFKKGDKTLVAERVIVYQHADA